MNAENITNHRKIYTSPYTVLPLIYDEMMSHVKYKRWAKYIRNILRAENFKKGHLLDIGCGTGEFLSHMAKYDYTLSGCDASFDMIKVASEKLPTIDIQLSTLPFLQEIPHNKYDIIVSLYDTMNYLSNELELKISFQNIYFKLKTPGIFIFDVVTKSYCEQHFQHYSENEVLEKSVAYSRESEFDSKNDMQINYIRIFTPEGIFEEIHKQRIYDLDFIRHLILENTSFYFANMLDDFSFQKANHNSGRVHFVLIKQKH